jgi:hypothetical protein
MNIWWRRIWRKLSWGLYRDWRREQRTRNLQQEEKIQRVYSSVRFEAYKRDETLPPIDETSPPIDEETPLHLFWMRPYQAPPWMRPEPVTTREPLPVQEPLTPEPVSYVSPSTTLNYPRGTDPPTGPMLRECADQLRSYSRGSARRRDPDDLGPKYYRSKVNGKRVWIDPQLRSPKKK